MRYISYKACISVILFGLIVSCEKEDTLAEKRIHTKRKDYVITGDYEYLTVKHINSTITTNKFIKLDINDDSFDDIKLQCKYEGSAGIGVRYALYLECLTSQIEILTSEVVDSIYIKTYSQEIEDPIRTSIRIHRYFYCGYDSIADSIFSVKNKKVVLPMYSDHKFATSDSFKNSDFTLYRDGYHIPGDREYLSADTSIIAYYSNYQEYCNGFPLLDTIYIGIKGDGTRLGWIRLAMLKPSEINIHEIAIQK